MEYLPEYKIFTLAKILRYFAGAEHEEITVESFAYHVDLSTIFKYLLSLDQEQAISLTNFYINDIHNFIGSEEPDITNNFFGLGLDIYNEQRKNENNFITKYIPKDALLKLDVLNNIRRDKILRHLAFSIKSTPSQKNSIEMYVTEYITKFKLDQLAPPNLVNQAFLTYTKSKDIFLAHTSHFLNQHTGLNATIWCDDLRINLNDNTNIRFVELMLGLDSEQFIVLNRLSVPGFAVADLNKPKILGSLNPNIQKLAKEIIRKRKFREKNSLKPEHDSSLKLPIGTKWEDITIHFQDKFRVVILVNQTKWTRTNYKDMGFLNKKKTNPTPTMAWSLLYGLSMHNGEISWENNNQLSQKELDTLKKRKQILSESLKSYFGLYNDPFYAYRKKGGNSYKIKINLIPEPSLMNASHRNESTGHPHTDILEGMEEELGQYISHDIPGEIIDD